MQLNAYFIIACQCQLQSYYLMHITSTRLLCIYKPAMIEAIGIKLSNVHNKQQSP